MPLSQPNSVTQPDTTLDPLLLRVCRGEDVETTPVWIMRQAGRYLPEYRRVREKADFLTVCRTPDLAVEVTLQPLRRFDLDAAILFSDIMIPVIGMGAKVEFAPGPVMDSPVRTEADIQALGRPDPQEAFGFVLETIRALRSELPRHVSLIGFAGAPFTLAAYMVEGGASKEFMALKSLMFREPVAFHALLEKLSWVVSDYLSAQIAAGAQVVQLFDTWAGLLSPADYAEFVLPHVQRVVDQVKKPGVPFILYGNGTSGMLEHLQATGADIISLDWRIDMGEARRRLGRKAGLQGNLDPGVLMASRELMELRVRHIIQAAGLEGPHIFNLGHGISRHTPVDSMTDLVSIVHEAGRDLRNQESS